jgi:para-aminobenzoate synthetase component 2
MSVSTPPRAGHPRRVLLVDNLDSFTWNLAQLIRHLGWDVTVSRTPLPTDAFDRIVLSPGPGRPEQFPWMTEVLAGARAPLFGVCLGMQGMALALGGRVVPAREVVHGKVRRVHHDGRGCFSGLPSPLRQARYHSLAVADLPAEAEVTAWTDDGEIMAFRVPCRRWEGVQFHPESVGSEAGAALVGRALGGG